MSAIVWGWAAVWLAWCLWLEWQVDGSWLYGTQDVREDYSRWSTPPEEALTPEGQRLWRRRYQVTVWGFLGWVVLVALWFVG